MSGDVSEAKHDGSANGTGAVRRSALFPEGLY